MKKILYSLLICASATAFAQKNPNVRFAVSNNAVGTVSMFDANKKYVQSVNVFKTKANIPQNLKKYDFLADNGLTEVKFKKDSDVFDKLLLSNYNIQHNLPENNPVYIDGYEFKDSSMMIFADIIGSTKVDMVNGQKVLTITTLKK